MKIAPVTHATYSQPVNPSSATEKSQQQTSQSAQPRMVSGPELVDLFADMFAYPSWSEKGVELTQETKEALYAAFKDALENKPEDKHGIIFNPHQIVMDHQLVPDWFREEKTMIDEMYGSEKFPNGEYYYYADKEEHDSESIRGFSPASLKAGQLDELMKELYAAEPIE
jgi:hypothetical protein